MGIACSLSASISMFSLTQCVVLSVCLSLVCAHTLPAQQNKRDWGDTILALADKIADLLELGIDAGVSAALTACEALGHAKRDSLKEELDEINPETQGFWDMVVKFSCATLKSLVDDEEKKINLNYATR